MNIPFSGAITRDEFAEAERLAYRGTSSSPMSISRLMVAAGLGLAVFSTYVAISRPGVADVAFAFPVPFFAVAYWLRKAPTGWGADPSLWEVREGALNDAGLHLRSAASETRLPWESFSGHAVGPTCVVVFHMWSRYYLFPRSHFANESGWSAFCAAIRERVEPKPRPTPPS